MSVYRRGKIWWVRFQWRGQEIRRSAKTTLRRVAVQFEHDLKEEFGRIHRGGKPRHTFEDLMIRFAEEHLPGLKPSAAKRYKVSARPLIKQFRNDYIDDINKGKIAEYIRRRKRDGVSSPTIRRDLACLSSALSCAVRWDWIEHNIVKALDKRHLREAPSRVRWARTKEYAAMIEAASVRDQTIITLLVETGMRLGELLNLERTDIDLGRREIYLTKTKTSAPRVVPLSDTASAQIRAHPEKLYCPYLFSTKNNKPLTVPGASASLKRTFKRAGIKDFRAHDLRHTFASWYLQRGGRLDRLQLILGHRRIEQTMKYAHLATQDLHDDMQRVGTRTGTGRTDSERNTEDDAG